jgi:hypothetical protein
MDSMFVPEGYTRVYSWSFLYIFSLTLPHSTAVQLAWPDAALHNGECWLLQNGSTRAGARGITLSHTWVCTLS